MALFTTMPARDTRPMPVITTTKSILKVEIPPNTPIVLNTILAMMMAGRTTELNCVTSISRISARAMNQIKHYYIRNFPEIDLKDAFLWTKDSMPAMYKPWSVHFMMALQVALLAGVTAGATTLFVSRALGGGDDWWWGVAGSVGFVAFLVQMIVYRSILHVKNPQATIDGESTSGPDPS